ncbi:MAG: M23 family metallopeptidase [Hyphomicrobiales bacterium]|nr:M23 family metallopeptidase [Hyphomicrobiales bacterium]MDE2017643.1 M23 family metallopeptidase [Hyphomicrobiales bacterium]
MAPVSSIRSQASAAPPRSHFFISVTRGRDTKTFATRPHWLWAAAIVFPLLAVWSVGSAAYIGLHDRLLAGMMAGEANSQYLYESRIASLRDALVKARTDAALGRMAVDRKLADVEARQKRVLQRFAAIDALAKATGASPGKAPALAAIDGLLGYAPVAADDKPRPIDGAPGAGAEVTTSVDPSKPLPDRVAAIDGQLGGVTRMQRVAIETVAAGAAANARRWRQAIRIAGITPAEARVPAAKDEGGPFIPVDAALVGADFARDLDGARSAVSRAAALKLAVARLPLRRPLAGAPVVTSRFGIRVDPFNGIPALHPGIDLHEAYGTPIKATGGGTVEVAGPDGGYGNLVVVDHGDGLKSYYGHMSAILVHVGQRVAKGETLGRLGSTGRSTGPHLHYEIRRDGKSIDPAPFLQASYEMKRGE